MRRPDVPAGTGLALSVLAVLVVIGILGEAGSGGGGGTPVPPSEVALSVYDGRSPSEPAGSEVRVLVELPRPALADRSDVESLSPGDQRAYVRSLKHEGEALRSALGARGVGLRDAVAFGRTWDGFAATVDASDLAALSSLGVRAEPVRRFYPATSEPVPVPGRPAPPARTPATTPTSGASPAGGASSAGGAASAGGASSAGGAASAGGASSAGSAPSAGVGVPGDGAAVAVLDTGVDVGVEPLRGRTAAGYDAVDRDADPAPGADVRSPGRRETTGTALAGIVAGAGEQVMPIRVAGYGPAGPEVHGTTDTLIAGLERAVDPDGDGAVDDAVRVALVGVNAPYAGFADSPEAQAVRGARKVGTLVVAPAGNEGPAQPPNGVVGSPGAARAALAVGATEPRGSAPRVRVTVGKRELSGAAVLGGAPPAGSARLAAPVTSTDAAALLRESARLAGHVALVRAGANPVAQATAAGAAGPRAILLADPRRRPLPMMPAARVAVPVIGLTGAAATAALNAKPGARVRFGRVSLGGGASSGGAASGGASSGGASSGGASSGGASSGGASSGGASSGGASSGGASSGGASSGTIGPQMGAHAPALFSSDGPAFDGTPKPDALADGVAVAPLPGGGQGLVTGTAVAAARLAVTAARLSRQRPAETAAGLRAALVAPTAAEANGAPKPPPVPVGPLRLTRRGGKVVGVRFDLGAFDRGDPFAGGSRLEPAARLDLELVDATGAVAQRLTPADGARDLLPAEYGYRLPDRSLEELQPGAYRFRATARAPRRTRLAVRRSPPFRIR